MLTDLAGPRDQTDDLEEAAPVTRRRFLVGGLGLSLAVGTYGAFIARHRLQVTERTILLRDLPHAFEGFRIIQLSDLHLEEFTEEYFLRHVVAKANALAADMVLVTGDFISSGPRSYSYSLGAAVRCAELLSALDCPLRFGCLGNHDNQVGARQVTERINPSGLTILSNRRVAIERGPDKLWIAGLDDPAHGTPDVAVTVPRQRDGPLMLMIHEPDYAAALALAAPDRSIDLLLSGHSHGGQVCLPGGYPLTLPPGARTFYEGLYRLERMQLYVNRGIGTVGVPFRLNCPPELTVITLHAA